MTDATEGTDASWREGMLSDAEHMELEDQMKAEEDLRARSDALLKLCGYRWDDWSGPSGMWRNRKNAWISPAPHPYADAQDAIDLAEAMGLRILQVYRNRNARRDASWCCVVERISDGKRFSNLDDPTIAAAICAAIEEAVE